MITWLRRPLWRLVGMVAVALMTGLVTLVLVRGSALPENPDAVPEAEALRLSLVLFGDLLAGLLAVTALPFALRPLPDGADTPQDGARAAVSGWALVAGVVVVATTALSTSAVPACSGAVVAAGSGRRPS